MGRLLLPWEVLWREQSSTCSCQIMLVLLLKLVLKMSVHCPPSFQGLESEKECVMWPDQWWTTPPGQPFSWSWLWLLSDDCPQTCTSSKHPSPLAMRIPVVEQRTGWERKKVAHTISIKTTRVAAWVLAKGPPCSANTRWKWKLNIFWSLCNSGKALNLGSV